MRVQSMAAVKHEPLNNNNNNKRTVTARLPVVLLSPDPHHLHYDSGQSLAAAESPNCFDYDPPHHPNSSVCKKPMAQSSPRSKRSSDSG
jgi:hypothetical protein